MRLFSPYARRSAREALRDSARGYRDGDTVCVKQYSSVSLYKKDVKSMAREGWHTVGQSSQRGVVAWWDKSSLVTYERSEEDALKHDGGRKLKQKKEHGTPIGKQRIARKRPKSPNGGYYI
jgi:hypothetical protein